MTNNTNQFISQSEREAFAAVGRIGGKATFRKHGKKYMSEIAKKGAKARWSKKDKIIKKETNK